jgi:hypothetical protein
MFRFDGHFLYYHRLKYFFLIKDLQSNFEWEPMPTSGLIGKSVEIRCLPPEGDPKPNIYWLKNGHSLDKSNKRVIVSHEGSLLINEVRISDAANYTCVAENIADKRLSDVAQLTVVANMGWSEWSNWTECESLNLIKCGEGTQKRSRKCLNPPTINNAIGCDGFPSQTITCYVPCGQNNNDDDTEAIASFSSNNDKFNFQEQHDEVRDEVVMSQNKVKKGFFWSQWSSWSMICDSECKRPRKRECKRGYMSNGKLVTVANQDEETIFVKKETRKQQCPGKDIEYGNCTFYCEPVTKQVTLETKTTTKGKFDIVNLKQNRFLIFVE